MSGLTEPKDHPRSVLQRPLLLGIELFNALLVYYSSAKNIKGQYWS